MQLISSDKLELILYCSEFEMFKIFIQINQSQFSQRQSGDL